MRLTNDDWLTSAPVY